MTTDFTRDGIEYSIAVRHAQGAYYATWTCTKCNVTGGPTHDCDNAKDAIACAEARAFSDHHFDRHVVVPLAAVRLMTRATSPAIATASRRGRL